MYKEVLINIESQERRIAVLENRVFEEYYIERTDQKPIVGNIYKGKVESIVPGIEAAFIDVGLEKNGFLYVSDIIEPVAEYDDLYAEGKENTEGKRRGNEDRTAKKHTPGRPKINELLKKGQEVLVQAVKEPFGTKGVRLTTHITMPGRYFVFMPTEKHTGISKRISDPKERQRLRSVLSTLRIPAGCGVIVRTAGVGKGKREFVRDLKYLIGMWRKIKSISHRRKAPSVIYEEYDLVLRMIRDAFNEEISKIIIDSKDEYRRAKKFLAIIMPQLRSKLELYKGEQTLFAKKGIDPEIEKIYKRRVDLKSGGYIIIEPTESLVAIDVNSGRFKGKKNLEDTAFLTNMEAAKEIARQIRLRDLGGIVIIDFIDMESYQNRKKVRTALAEAMKRDKAKYNILPVSELGLVEMTRQRLRRSLESVAYKVCPYCEGRGTVKSITTMSIKALRMLKKHFVSTKKKEAQLWVNPEVATRLLNEDRSLVVSIENKFRVKVTIKSEPSLHVEDIMIK
jgi:ribonuclease G